MSNLKKLTHRIKNLSMDNYHFLLAIDRFGAYGDGENIFLEVDFLNKLIETEKHMEMLKSRLFSNYMIEMLFYYSMGKKEIYLDIGYHRQNTQYKKSKYEKLSTIYNLYHDFTTKPIHELSSIANILLPIAYEQIEIQENFNLAYKRFLQIYAKNTEINDICIEKLGISLQRYIAICWIVFAYINQLKDPIFTKNDLFQYLSSTNVTIEELEIFLDMTSLSLDEFKEKYINFRKDENSDMFSYHDREYFDKALPRISYFFPFIRTENRYKLISYTGYMEFFKMKSIYRKMTEEFIDIHFKSKYAGPLFEKYVKELVEGYKTISKLDGIIYGDREYSPKKGFTYREPDVIFETEDYIVIIECKSTPFSLNFIKYLNPSKMSKLKEEIETTIKNIDDRFLKYYDISKDKQIVKILVFYEAHHMVLSLLNDDINTIVASSNLNVMDIGSLELLLYKYIKPIPDILHDYNKEKKQASMNLNSYLYTLVGGEDMIKDEDETRDFIFNSLGLEY